MKYRVMLADDEGIVIDSLKFIIEKEFGETCEVAFAKSGRSVIELAESFRPDIAIMDIQMPGINGIEAMKEIRRTNQNVIFIVMSAYDKFDYAKEAIKLGVMEYISKPMERKKIVSALNHAMEKIQNDRAKRSNDLLIREKLETVIPIIETGLIYNILLQDHFSKDIENYKEILNIKEKYGYMICIVCGEKLEGNHMTNAVGSSVRMQKYYQKLRADVKEYFPCIVGTVMSNKLAVMVKSDTAMIDYNERVALIDKTRELVRKLRKEADIEIRIGLGSIKPLEDLKESYQEAMDALNASKSSVAHVEDLPIRCEYGDNYPIHLEKRLFSNIENGLLEEATETAEEFFDWLIDNHAESQMDIKLKVLEFVLWAEHIAYEAGGMVYRINIRTDYLPTIMELDSHQLLRDWFIQKISIACQNIKNKRNEKSSSIIHAAKEYIKENYSKDISLDEVSRVVNISPYYFSKLFKEETKEGFIEYLTNIRINQAKELLSKNEFSMKEICSMVGYSDPNYFSRSFKKNVGVTPTEYKEGR